MDSSKLKKMCRYCLEKKEDSQLKYPCRCTAPVCDECIKQWTKQDPQNISKCPECHGKYKWKKRPRKERYRVKREQSWWDWTTVYILGYLAWIFTVGFTYCIATIFWMGRFYEPCKRWDGKTIPCDDIFMWYDITGVVGTIPLILSLVALPWWYNSMSLTQETTMQKPRNGNPPRNGNKEVDISLIYVSIGKILLGGFVVDIFIILTSILFHSIGGGVLLLFNAYPYSSLNAKCDFVTKTLCLNINGVTFGVGVLSVLCIIVGYVIVYVIVLIMFGCMRAMCSCACCPKYETHIIYDDGIEDAEIDNYYGSVIP